MSRVRLVSLPAPTPAAGERSETVPWQAPYTATVYALWDVEAGNLIEEFPTLAAALAAIRDDVVELGRQDAETYLLFQETADQPRVIAEGTGLVNLALQSELAHPSAHAS